MARRKADPRELAEALIGGSLAGKILSGGPITIEQATDVTRDLLRTLETHGLEVVHRAG